MPTIKLFANLRKVAGLKETIIAGKDIQEVLTELIRQKPGLEHYLVENGHIRRHVVITINGHPTTDEQAPVTEKDEIAVFPPIAGGSPPLSPHFHPLGACNYYIVAGENGGRPEGRGAERCQIPKCL